MKKTLTLFLLMLVSLAAFSQKKNKRHCEARNSTYSKG